MSTIFIDKSGDTGFKLDQGSSSYFVLSSVVFDTTTAVIDAINRIEELLKDGNYDQNSEH